MGVHMRRDSGNSYWRVLDLERSTRGDRSAERVGVRHGVLYGWVGLKQLTSLGDTRPTHAA